MSINSTERNRTEVVHSAASLSLEDEARRSRKLIKMHLSDIERAFQSLRRKQKKNTHRYFLFGWLFLITALAAAYRVTFHILIADRDESYINIGAGLVISAMLGAAYGFINRSVISGSTLLAENDPQMIPSSLDKLRILEKKLEQYAEDLNLLETQWNKSLTDKKHHRVSRRVCGIIAYLSCIACLVCIFLLEVKALITGSVCSILGSTFIGISYGLLGRESSYDEQMNSDIGFLHEVSRPYLRTAERIAFDE